MSDENQTAVDQPVAPRVDPMELRPWLRPGLSMEERERLRGPMYVKYRRWAGHYSEGRNVLSLNWGGRAQDHDELLAKGWKRVK